MKKDVIGSLFCLLFGIFFTVESFRFGLGIWSKPGPGYFPFGAGVLFSLISLFVLVSAIRKTASGESAAQPDDRFYLKNILLIVIGMLVYALLLKKVGFALCTFGLVIFLIRVIARKGWVNSIVTGLIVGIAFHVFFNMLLNAQLPNGILEFVLG
jgi:putative tricarboxylic transport membrane protein